MNHALTTNVKLGKTQAVRKHGQVTVVSHNDFVTCSGPVLLDPATVPYAGSCPMATSRHRETATVIGDSLDQVNDNPQSDSGQILFECSRFLLILRLKAVCNYPSEGLLAQVLCGYFSFSLAAASDARSGCPSDSQSFES